MSARAGAGPDGTRTAGGHRRRRVARRAAIDILYQADIRSCTPSEALHELVGAGRSAPAYTAQIVAGVEEGLDEIDRALGESAEEWTVPRMAAVDRAILRVACYEISAGIPAAVAIDEAVSAANELSTEASGRFINGVLGRLARD